MEEFEKIATVSDIDDVANEINETASDNGSGSPVQSNEGPESNVAGEEPAAGAEPIKEKSKRGGRRAGAGRKPKTETEEGPDTEKPSDPTDQIAEEINGPKSEEPKEEFDETKYETIVIEGKDKAEYKAFLTGMILLMGLNMFFPVLCLKIVTMIYPKAKTLKPEQVQLDEKQLALLEECADEVAKQIFTQLPPFAQLAVGMSIMTVGNITMRLKSMD